MKTLIGADECVGKTVREVITDDEFIAVHFTDDTVLVAQVDLETDDDDAYVSLSAVDGPVGVPQFDPTTGLLLGVYTKEESEAMREQTRKRTEEQIEANDRARYEELRQKFEGAKPPGAP